MAYIEKNYYTDNYHGTEMSDDDFANLARAASLIIDVVTFGRAAKVTDAKSLSAVKTATATEVEYLYYQGGVDAINGKGDNLKTAEDIGNYNYTKSGDGTLSVGGIPISPLCLALLDSVGLRYPGV